MTAPVLVIIGLFFLIGITVGVTGVIAMANMRRDRHRGPDNPSEHDDRPRWPGDAGSGY